MKIKDHMSLCSTHGLQVKRGGREVLRKVDFKLERNGPYAIVGTSGSGKTTLLYALTGLLNPSSGKIRYGDQELADLSRPERASRYGLVFQDYQLFPHLTVIENLLLAPHLRKLPVFKEQACDLLGRLGVSSLAERYPSDLSGGQKQRVAIARSLLLEPQILFLDEPSAALDEKTSLELAELLAGLNEKSQIVAVSHDRPFLAAFCTGGIRMNQGWIDREGTVEEILA